MYAEDAMVEGRGTGAGGSGDGESWHVTDGYHVSTESPESRPDESTSMD